MDLVLLDTKDGVVNLVSSPLLGLQGISIRGFWRVANALTKMNLGNRCNEEWQKRLDKVKRRYRMAGL